MMAARETPAATYLRELARIYGMCGGLPPAVPVTPVVLVKDEEPGDMGLEELIWILNGTGED